MKSGAFCQLLSEAGVREVWLHKWYRHISGGIVGQIKPIFCLRALWDSNVEELLWLSLLICTAVGVNSSFMQEKLYLLAI